MPHTKKKTLIRTTHSNTPVGSPTRPYRPNLSPLASSPPPPHSYTPSASSSSCHTFKAPTPLGVSAPHTSALKGVMAMDAQRQTCEYCGRHFRSLGRHLDKHHAHQPDVCSALVERYTQMPRLQVHRGHHSSSSVLANVPAQPGPTAPAQQQLHPHHQPQQGVVQDLSMSPPTLTAANQSPTSTGRSSAPPPALSPTRGRGAVPVSVLKRSPPPPATMAAARKGSVKKSGEEEEEDDDDEVEVVDVKRPKEEEEEEEVEVVCPLTFNGTSLVKEAEPQLKREERKEEGEYEEAEEEEEENGVMDVDDDSAAEDKEKDLMR